MGISLANKISLVRIFLVPFFAGCLLYYRPEHDGLRYLAIAVFLTAVLTDAIDGYIARSKTQWSRLGTFLDPLADKLLLLTAFGLLAMLRTMPEDLRIPGWLVIVVVTRDGIIILGTALVYHLTGKLDIRPSRLGKWATLAQMIVVLTVLLRWPYTSWVWWVTAALTIASGIVYLRRGTRLLSSA